MPPARAQEETGHSRSGARVHTDLEEASCPREQHTGPDDELWRGPGYGNVCQVRVNEFRCLMVDVRLEARCILMIEQNS